VLAGFSCPLLAVRLLRLKVGSRIREHTDLNLGYEDGEIRVHVPIHTNPGVEFYLAGQRVILNEGECWYINTSLPHRVVNAGEADRIHLVIDCVVDDWVRDLFEEPAHG
jgi:aspartyl/asparaginyl beta-hydroxylase (cupin superfamily)